MSNFRYGTVRLLYVTVLYCIKAALRSELLGLYLLHLQLMCTLVTQLRHVPYEGTGTTEGVLIWVTPCNLSKMYRYGLKNLSKFCTVQPAFPKQLLQHNNIGLG